MCTSDCVRPRDAHLSQLALDTLAGLYEHPVVRILAQAFRAAGGTLFVVGGPVRDALRGHADFADLDFTTNLMPAQTRRVLNPLGSLWMSGENFGTIGVSINVGGLKQKVEVTTFRTETYNPASRKPEVGFGDSIVDDLKRRDLTVNAVAMNVTDGCLVDPFGGIADLAARVLDTPDDPIRTLSEDPLRILRAIRFAGRLDASPSARLTAAVSQTRDRLSIVSAERKLAELDKLAELGPDAMAAGLRLAAELGVLPDWIPQSSDDSAVLARLNGCAGADEVLASLWAAAGLTIGLQVEGPLRAMKMPVHRIRTVKAQIDLAADLRVAAATVPQARRVLRIADDNLLASAARVCQVSTGLVPELVSVAELVRDREPQVRQPLPVSGTDLRDLGLAGPPLGAFLRRLEKQFCAEGALDRDLVLSELSGSLTR